MWSAAILAGGEARRFGGADKGRLVVEGSTIRDRQLAALAAVAGEILVVGDAAGSDPRVRTVGDRTPGCGPLGGLETALLEASGAATVVVAGDMPFLCAPLLEHLLTLTTDADAVVPRTERGYHPLCAAYTRRCLDPIGRRLATGRLRATDLLSDLRVRVVSGEELGRFGDAHRLLANVNTPEQYQALAGRRDHEL